MLQYLREKYNAMDKKQLMMVFLLFLLAFGVRAHLMQYELFFGFDSYWHARIVGYVVEDGVAPEYDPLGYYQLEEGGAPLGSPGPVFWQLSAFLHKLFTFGRPYAKEAWISSVKLLPALYGALIVVAVFFLLREMYSPKAGYAGAFFAALVPSYVYRTMASFFEEDSLGFLWMMIGFYFFVKAVKSPALSKEHIKNVILSGIFFGILAWTWGMFLMVPLILIAYLFWMIILMWFRGENREKITALVALFAVVFVIMGTLATLEDGGAWFGGMTEYVKQYAPVTPENIEKAQSKGPGVLQQTIGEENVGNLFWGTKYNALIIFPFAAIFLGIFRILRNPKDRVTLILIFWAMLALYMAFNKLKFTYVLGLPIAACAGFVFEELFVMLKRRDVLEKALVGVALAFMMLIAVSAGSFFVTQKYPHIEMGNGWKKTLRWVNENTPEDTKFFNWWDEGHWISFIGERRVSCDNRNYSFEADQDFALFALSQDENKAYEIVKNYGADYVIFDNQIFNNNGPAGAMNSMAIYAYNTLDPNDMRLYKLFGVAVPCGVSAAADGTTTYNCGGNKLNQSAMDTIPYKWQAIPNNFQDERMPTFVYRNRDKSYIFIFNDAMNKTIPVKLWFDHPELKHFEEVEVDDEHFSPAVKIFKVVD